MKTVAKDPPPVQKPLESITDSRETPKGKTDNKKLESKRKDYGGT